MGTKSDSSFAQIPNSSNFKVFSGRHNTHFKSHTLKLEKSKKASLRLGGRKVDSSVFDSLNVENNSERIKESVESSVIEPGISNLINGNDTKENKALSGSEEIQDDLNKYFINKPSVSHSAKESMTKINQWGTSNDEAMFDSIRYSLDYYNSYYENFERDCSEFKRPVYTYLQREIVHKEKDKDQFLKELDLLRVGTSPSNVASRRNALLMPEPCIQLKSPIKACPDSQEAQRKFGSAKSISSQQYFNDPSNYEGSSGVSRFANYDGISSDMYFNHSVPEKSDFIDLEEVQQCVKEGIIKVAGKLSSFAGGVLRNI